MSNSLNRFFVPSGSIGDGKVRIEGSDARQICTVLRLGRGDCVNVLDGSGCMLTIRITEAAPSCVVGDVTDMCRPDTEPPVRLTLAQSLPKSDKLEFVIQKGTELGVEKFQIIRTARSIPRASDDKVGKKLLRWQTIAKEAAEQSCRTKVPEVAGITTIEELAASISDYDLAVCLWECEEKRGLREILKKSRSAESILLIIGPEGGLEETEVRMLESHGARVASLGRRILRCETAAVASSAIIMYEYEMETP